MGEWSAAPDDAPRMGPDAARAYRDQLRARGRDAGGKDIAVRLDPSDGEPCGHGDCENVATRGIVLLDRPDMKPDTGLAACDEHEDEMWLIHSGLEPPA